MNNTYPYSIFYFTKSVFDEVGKNVPRSVCFQKYSSALKYKGFLQENQQYIRPQKIKIL